jgi:enhancing lycopene biosynthesis protein 2
MDWLFIEDLKLDEYRLSVYKCPCGHHIGIDTDVLEDIGSFHVQCPICGKEVLLDSEE